MKTFHILGAILLLLAPAHGQTLFVDAGRFIHLRLVDDEQRDDTYIRAETIDAVVIHQSEREADKERPFKVQLTTRMLTTRQRSSPEAWSTDNRIYEIDCSSRKEAEKVATAIVMACSGGTNGKKAEQAGTEQPATRSQSKSEGSAKPQPEEERRSR